LGFILAGVILANGGDESLLPAWFWDTPEIPGVRLAVGYSLPYQDSETAYQEAFRDGCWRLFTDWESRITGGRAHASAPEGTMHMGDTFAQVIDSTLFPGFMKNVVRLDSFSTPEIRVVLVGTGKANIDRNLTKAPSEKPAISRSVLQARFSAPLYYYLSSSWKEAEAKARIELALSGFAVTKGLGSVKDQAALSVMNLETHVFLINVQTIHRRIHDQSGVVTIWVRGSVIPAESPNDEPEHE